MYLILLTVIDGGKRKRRKSKVQLKPKLPLWCNAAILLLFCAVGAVTYRVCYLDMIKQAFYSSGLM
jgi:hypothetical protein